MDIWRPYRVPQLRFFLTIVEDFSRAMWTYLIEHKSQALAVLVMYLNLFRHILQRCQDCEIR